MQIKTKKWQLDILLKYAFKKYSKPFHDKNYFNLDLFIFGPFVYMGYNK